MGALLLIDLVPRMVIVAREPRETSYWEAWEEAYMNRCLPCPQSMQEGLYAYPAAPPCCTRSLLPARSPAHLVVTLSVKGGDKVWEAIAAAQMSFCEL
jgi:hypothetical protein